MNEKPSSPRARLLARHASMTPRLDALRRAALPVVPAQSWRAVLHELFFPQRVAWGALATVWIGLAVFHLTLGRPPATTSPAIPVDAVAAWLNQLKSNETLAQIDLRR